MTAPDCLAPQRCPVPAPETVDLRRLRLAHLEPGRVLDRVFANRYDLLRFNSSRDGGSGRFTPLHGRSHLYAGDTRTVALLETVFHNVHRDCPRVIYTATDLADRSLGRLVATRRLPLIDLRDAALHRLDLDRSQLTATTSAHYPCTRRWATALMDRRVGGVSAVGLMWNSRVAELARGDSMLLDDLLETTASEACVLYDDGSTMFAEAAGGFGDLVGPTQGRLLVEEIAEQLDAMVV